MTKIISCTVQILTKNVAPSLTRCLESLKEFEEVLLQDGYSTDATREIAAKFPNVRIVDQHKAYLDGEGRITDFAAMRNDGLHQATYAWILMVDADEYVSPQFVSEVRSIVEKNVPGVFKVFRRFYVNGEKIDRCAGYPAYHIRLFHRDLTEGYVKPVHEKLKLHPGVTPQVLENELAVPLPESQSLYAKEERYLQMEVKRQGRISWSHWFKWIFLRNLRSALGLSVLVFLTWVTPGRGKRMPFAYDWHAIRYSLRVIWATMPSRNR